MDAMPSFGVSMAIKCLLILNWLYLFKYYTKDYLSYILDDVRSVLLAALEKAAKSLKDIKDDVKQGMVWKVARFWKAILPRLPF